MANREATMSSLPWVGMADRAARAIGGQASVTRRAAVGTMLLVALVAFELFNFDTTEFALESLLGTVAFVGVRWATILAVAFCSIDFAGFTRLLLPDRRASDSVGSLRPTTLLMAAWLLGAAVNATLTWWAVSLVLISHNLGNEVLSREQLLHVVPVLVAVLVWVTRLLIISALVSKGHVRASRPAAAGWQPARLRPVAVSTARRQVAQSTGVSGARQSARRSGNRSPMAVPLQRADRRAAADQRPS